MAEGGPIPATDDNAPAHRAMRAASCRRARCEADMTVLLAQTIAASPPRLGETRLRTYMSGVPELVGGFSRGAPRLQSGSSVAGRRRHATATRNCGETKCPD